MRPDFSQPAADETEQKTGGPNQRPIPSHQEGESTKAPEQPFFFADEGENQSEMPQLRGDLVAVSSTTFVPDSPRDATAFYALRNNILPTPRAQGGRNNRVKEEMFFEARKIARGIFLMQVGAGKAL